MVSSEDDSATDSDNSSGEVPASNSSLFSEGERVLAYHGPKIYEAKVQRAEVRKKEWRYFVHYLDWNKNWDEWVDAGRLLKHNAENVVKQETVGKKQGGDKNPKLGRSAQVKPKSSADAKVDKEETKNTGIDHTCIRRRVHGVGRGQEVSDADMDDMLVDDQAAYQDMPPQQPPPVSQPMPPQDQFQQAPPNVPTTGPFVPTRQMHVDYAFANSQWHLYESFNNLRQTMDSFTGRPSAPLQFHYHGYPFSGYYSQHPESFAADSTDYIPEYQVPFMQTTQLFPTYYDHHPQGSGHTQFAGTEPLSGHSGSHPGQYSSGQQVDYFGQHGSYSGGQYGSYSSGQHGGFSGGATGGGAGNDGSAPVYDTISDGSGDADVLSDS